MNGFITQLLAAMAVSLLRYLQQREDLKQSVKDSIEKESLAYALKAQEWKARAGVTADTLRVQSGASLSLQDRNTDDDGLSIYHSCDIRDDATGAKEPTECVTLVRSDYRQIIVNLKAACLASGQSHEACQTGE